EGDVFRLGVCHVRIVAVDSRPVLCVDADERRAQAHLAPGRRELAELQLVPRELGISALGAVRERRLPLLGLKRPGDPERRDDEPGLHARSSDRGAELSENEAASTPIDRIIVSRRFESFASGFAGLKHSVRNAPRSAILYASIFFRLKSRWRPCLRPRLRPPA